jgi:hypothetical protein
VISQPKALKQQMILRLDFAVLPHSVRHPQHRIGGGVEAAPVLLDCSIPPTY